MRRMVNVPIDIEVGNKVFEILSLLGFEVELEADYRNDSMIIRVYDGEERNYEVRKIH